MKIKGNIVKIGNVQDISQSFRKRELVLKTVEQYPQFIMVEFVQDKAGLLDANFCKQGAFVEVSINLKGREWKNPQGDLRYFNSIQGWRIQEAVEEVAVEAQSPDRDDDLPF
jgi:single-strand DNA-binding protein